MSPDRLRASRELRPRSLPRTATQALTEPEEAHASPQAPRQDRRRVKELEHEPRRKDRALAEMAALLVLSGKVALIFDKGETECALPGAQRETAPPRVGAAPLSRDGECDYAAAYIVARRRTTSISPWQASST
jgi:transposase